jgi:ribonuclease T2
MRHRKRIATTALAVGFMVAVPASARRHRPGAHGRQPGVFDYYVLSLSWSPQHCAGHSGGANDPQCGLHRNYGFVVHGLWPLYESGFPQSCAAGGTLDPTVINSVIDIMPSSALVRHEWAKHGTCTGMDSPAYFAKVRAAYAAINIPPSYHSLRSVLRVAVSQIKHEFGQANPDLDGNDLAVLCDGKFLQEVRVCFDKDLHPRTCGRDVRDACRNPVTIRPIR